MKTLILLLAFAVGSSSGNPEIQTGTLSATVSNVNGEEGDVLFALYTADTFMKQQPQFSAKGKIVNGKSVVTFENVPAGTYALVVLHDKNRNGRMDFDPSGMPQEDYGTSGNSYSYGPPNWEESQFRFDGSEAQVEIRL